MLIAADCSAPACIQKPSRYLQVTQQQRQAASPQEKDQAHLAGLLGDAAPATSDRQQLDRPVDGGPYATDPEHLAELGSKTCRMAADRLPAGNVRPAGVTTPNGTSRALSGHKRSVRRGGREPSIGTRRG